MFGRVEAISGEARTNLRAVCPRVRSLDAVRKSSCSIFFKPSRSHSFGRWRRWSFLAKVVSSVFLPSSMPEEWGTRTSRLVRVSREAAIRVLFEEVVDHLYTVKRSLAHSLCALLEPADLRSKSEAVGAHLTLTHELLHQLEERIILDGVHLCVVELQKVYVVGP